MIGKSQVKIYVFASRGDWFTACEAARKTGINPRTVRWHLLRLTQIGVLERRTSFGGCRYRMATHLSGGAADHVRELEAAQNHRKCTAVFLQDAQSFSSKVHTHFHESAHSGSGSADAREG